MVEPDWASAEWRKSGRSSNQGGNCVEVAVVGDLIGLRDSKNPAGGVLVFARDRWRDFLAGIRNGEFDESDDGTDQVG